MIAGLVFLAMGIVLLGTWFRQRNLAKETLTWPQVPGNIVKSKIEDNPNGDNQTFIASVLYFYAVDGTQLQSKSVAFTGMQSARQIVRKYPARSAGASLLRSQGSPVRGPGAELDRTGRDIVHLHLSTDGKRVLSFRLGRPVRTRQTL